MKSCAGRELAWPLLLREKPGSGHPKIICFIQSDAIKHSHTQLGTTCATSGEEGHLRIQWSGNKSLLSFFLVCDRNDCNCVSTVMRTYERLLWTRSNLINSFAVCPDYSSLICGGGGKLDKKTNGGAAFEYFPFSECRSEADAATLELWNNRPGTVRSAESLKAQLLKQQPLFSFIFDLNEILFQVQRFIFLFVYYVLFLLSTLY